MCLKKSLKWQLKTNIKKLQSNKSLNSFMNNPRFTNTHFTLVTSPKNRNVFNLDSQRLHSTTQRAESCYIVNACHTRRQNCYLDNVFLIARFHQGFGIVPLMISYASYIHQLCSCFICYCDIL